jgi:hypothetical protein
MNIFEYKDVLTLIIKHITNGIDYFRLMQVNKLCWRVCKELLIHKSNKRRLLTWTEIPGRPSLINGVMKRVTWNGHIVYEHGYINGKKHGIVTGVHKIKQIGGDGLKKQILKETKYKFLFKNGRQVRDLNVTSKNYRLGENIMDGIFITSLIALSGGVCILLYHVGCYIFNWFNNKN